MRTLKKIEMIRKNVLQIKISKRRVMYILIGIFMSSLITFLRPRIVGELTDEGLTNGNFSIVLWYCLILSICAIVEYGNELLQINFFIKLNNDFVENLYRIAIDKILKAPYFYSQSRTSAEIVNTINSDINRMSTLLDRNSFTMIRFIFQIIGGTIGIFIINWKIAIVLLVVIPVKQLIVNQLAKKRMELTRKYLEENKVFSNWVANQINGVFEIKMWNLYQRKNEEFSKKYKKIPSLYEKLGWCDGIENILGMATCVLLEIMIYILCGYMVCKGRMSIGELLAFVSYTMYVANPLDVLSNIPYMWAQIRPSVERFLELLEWLEESLKSNICVELDKMDIELKHVSFEYYKGHEVLKDVDLKIPEGKKVAIIGENGVGKTTLINLLLGIVSPTSGEIYLGEKSLEQIGVTEWRRNFAVVGQKPYLFQGTLKENVDFYDEYSIEYISKLANELGIDLNIEQREHGFFYQVKNDGINLSGGEKQKIAFLRAFIKNSRMLILDEMFSNCDEETRKNIQKIIFDSQFNKTVIIISHYEEDISNVDVVYEMKSGKIIKL